MIKLTLLDSLHCNHQTASHATQLNINHLLIIDGKPIKVIVIELFLSTLEENRRVNVNVQFGRANGVNAPSLSRSKICGIREQGTKDKLIALTPGRRNYGK